MLKIDPKEISISRLHHYILGSVAPRPIAFASTIDKKGNPNLAPFSFFNAFGSNPPILVFSPSRRVHDNTVKHTFENIKEVGEVVINVVNFAMLRQMSIASMEYPKDVNEFIKSGFTQLESEKVKPFRVKESPVQFECVVTEINETGTEGGAGNLIISEIVLMHVSDDVLDDEGKIDAKKIDLVARMGSDYYARAHGDAIFEVEKPGTSIGIGFDNIPEDIRNSSILTGSELGQLASVESLPANDEVQAFASSEEMTAIKNDAKALHVHAQTLLKNGNKLDAWKTLLLSLREN